jgi:membrane-associated protease RseP (regulator of RpoE activity)
VTNGYVVALFYASIIALIFYYRDKFEFEGIIAMYKTEWGLRLMDRVAKRHPWLLRAFSVSGIVVGYITMLGMLGIVWIGIQNILYRPSAPAAFVPLLPGVSVPGSPISPPLVQTLISIFIVVLIHEFSHGMIARLYDIDVKSSGLVLLGPIPGAFVEPEQEQLEQSSQETTQGLFAAGPYANILLGIPVFFIVVAGVGFTDAAVSPVGAEITGVVNQSSANQVASLQEGDVITAVNGTTVTTRSDLIRVLQGTKANESVRVTTTDAEQTITLGSAPQNESAGFLGVRATTKQTYTSSWQAQVVEQTAPVYYWLFGDYRPALDLLPTAYAWPAVLNLQGSANLGLFAWIFIVTTGIAGANLLPIGPLDGGQMWRKTLHGFLPERAANITASITTWALFIIVLGLLFIPMIQALL